MRSRPKVKTYLRPAVARPGAPLDVEIVLTSPTETPVDFVEMCLTGREAVQFGRYGAARNFLALAAHHDKCTLDVGERRFGGRFDLPSVLPPSYAGGAASIGYELAVHVSIPWWPDRRQRFTIPVAATASPFAPTPQTVVSTFDGPRGTVPFIEASLDSTTIEAGGELAGAVSITNTAHSTIRGIDLVLGAIEAAPPWGSYETSRRRWRIHDGPPEEGKTLPFRVAIGSENGISLVGQLFALSWYVAVVVKVAWGSDATLRVPVTLVARAADRVPAPRGAGRWVAPVGRERRALVWATVAEKYGMTNDADEERMTASIGGAALVVRLQQRGTDGLFLIATVRWPSLGIDLHVEPRSLVDLLVRGIEMGPSDAARRFTVRAREAAQARAVLGQDAMTALAAFQEVHVDDEGATLAARGGVGSTPQLESFLQCALVAVRGLAAGVARVPPPEKMAASLADWESCAQRLGGELDRGPMRIRGARLATDTGEIATLWSRDGEVVGTALRVPLSPPLVGPLDLESPSLSQQARELAKRIMADAASVRLGPDALEARVEGPLADPAAVEPLLERLAHLARSFRGASSAGPFR